MVSDGLDRYMPLDIGFADMFEDAMDDRGRSELEAVLKSRPTALPLRLLLIAGSM